MTEEIKIKQELEEKFDCLKDKVNIKRDRRIFADVPVDKFDEIFAFTVKQMHFNAISAITGMDNGEDFTVMYHLNKDGKIVLSLAIRVNKDTPSIKTVTPYFASAEMYEREIMDLLGIQIDGLPAGSRYPLPDSWPTNEHPLRKDWKASQPEKGDEKCITPKM
jgi:membrane-bound hydrogenase subunit beta